MRSVREDHILPSIDTVCRNRGFDPFVLELSAIGLSLEHHELTPPKSRHASFAPVEITEALNGVPEALRDSYPAANPFW